MKMAPFSEFLRRQRRKLGLSQTKTASRCGSPITQSLLSNWERGMLPKIGDKRLAVLAPVLGTSSEELERLSEQQRQSEQDMASPFDDEMHFRNVQEHVHQALKRGGGVSVWVFGPHQRGYLRSTRLQSSWRENLQAGVEYHVVWLLDMMSAMDFHLGLDALVKLAPTVSEARAKMHFHGISVLPKEQRSSSVPLDERGFNYPRCMSVYEELLSEGLANTCVHPIVELNGEGEIVIEVLRHVDGLMATATYSTKRLTGGPPLTGYYIPKMKRRRSALEAEDVWGFLGEDAGWEQLTFIRTLERHIANSEKAVTA